MSRTSPRFAGVLVSAAILVVAGLLWRGCLSPDSAPGAATSAAAPRRATGRVRQGRAPLVQSPDGGRPAERHVRDAHAGLARAHEPRDLRAGTVARRKGGSRARDGQTHTLHLRKGVTWSDGTPFTSADVLFTLQAIYDPKVESVVASNVMPGGRPIQATALDASTVVLTYAASSGIGDRTARHVSDPAEAQARGSAQGRDVRQGLEHGHRRRQRSSAPVRSCCASSSRASVSSSIATRLLAHRARRSEAAVSRSPRAADHSRAERRAAGAAVRRHRSHAERAASRRLRAGPARGAGRQADDDRGRRRPRCRCLLVLPEAGGQEERSAGLAFLQKREFRQALSHAVDREEFAQTVFLGEAVPVWGPITPGNRPWFSPNIPRYPYDLARARELLKSIGLEDRNGNGVVETADGVEARFTVMTQRGIAYYERGVTVLREQAAKVGIALDDGAAGISDDDRADAGVPVRRDLHAAVSSRSSIRPATWTSGSARARRISGTSGRRRRPRSGKPGSTRSCTSRRRRSIPIGGASCSTTRSASWPRTCRCCTSWRRACTMPTAVARWASSRR